MRKRGCIYCLDHRFEKQTPIDTKRFHLCIRGVCPYHELDRFDSYYEYLQHKEESPLAQILKEIAEIHKSL